MEQSIQSDTELFSSLHWNGEGNTVGTNPANAAAAVLGAILGTWLIVYLLLRIVG